MATWSSILMLLCCTRILLYAKMLKKKETEKTQSFVVFIFVIGDV